jgi:hypothetical protein
LNPDPVYATLKFSHPELSERLAALGYEAKPIEGDSKSSDKYHQMVEEAEEEEDKKLN